MINKTYYEHATNRKSVKWIQKANNSFWRNNGQRRVPTTWNWKLKVWTRGRIQVVLTSVGSGVPSRRLVPTLEKYFTFSLSHTPLACVQLISALEDKKRLGELIGMETRVRLSCDILSQGPEWLPAVHLTLGSVVQLCNVGWLPGVRERDHRLRGRSTEECLATPASRQDLALATINVLPSSWGVDPRTRPANLLSFTHPRRTQRWGNEL